MSLSRHLEEATSRLEGARQKIEEQRDEPASLESLRAWLAGLTEAINAVVDIQTYNNESIHEKLQALARRERL